MTQWPRPSVIDPDRPRPSPDPAQTDGIVLLWAVVVDRPVDWPMTDGLMTIVIDPGPDWWPNGRMTDRQTSEEVVRRTAQNWPDLGEPSIDWRTDSIDIVGQWRYYYWPVDIVIDWRTDPIGDWLAQTIVLLTIDWPSYWKRTHWRPRPRPSWRAIIGGEMTQWTNVDNGPRRTVIDQTSQADNDPGQYCVLDDPDYWPNCEGRDPVIGQTGNDSPDRQTQPDPVVVTW